MVCAIDEVSINTYNGALFELGLITNRLPRYNYGLPIAGVNRAFGAFASPRRL